MIQDNQLFEDFKSLPPEGKAEVIDLVQRLKAKKNQLESSDKENPLLKYAGVLADTNIEQPEDPPPQSILEILEEAPGQLVFKSAEEVDSYIASERNEWDN